MNHGVIYWANGFAQWRECATEEQAREVYEHAPQADDSTAKLIVNGVIVAEREAE